ncbi:hypothetical protein K488DRAFT_81429 [Vararia minispora EC-137]|uniref:Uncharacterized protein n=1 Tax=Vararia minispora EC-137 TaxID=1314806 RepID=A0ACB8R0P8_9AGAM|nr:hypothetical protein K488DRAFT_81429 [Vararia minispora EC-137]
MNLSLASSIPPELILHIFFMTKPHRTPRDFIPDSFLPKLALVNRTYLEVARERLYTDVFLTGHGSLSTKDVVCRFLWTLQVQPSLTEQVHGIHYGATDVEDDEVRCLSDAVSRIGNLLRLRIFGFDSDYTSLKRLSQVVQSLHTLQEFEISTFSLTNKYSSIFCGLVSFFEMLLRWPDIRSVIVHSQTIGWERNSTFSLSEAIPSCCTKLRRLVYHSAEYWEDRHLEVLSRMAPELEELAIGGVLTSENLTGKGLSSALEAWLSSLRILSLHFPHSEKEAGVYDKFRLDSAITQLPELRVLDVGSAYLRPISLVRGPPKLTTLDLSIKADEGHAAELADVLRDPLALPMLSELFIRLDTKITQQDIADLYTLCTRRRVLLNIRHVSR